MRKILKSIGILLLIIAVLSMILVMVVDNLELHADSDLEYFRTIVGKIRFGFLAIFSLMFGSFLINKSDAIKKL